MEIFPLMKETLGALGQCVSFFFIDAERLAACVVFFSFFLILSTCSLAVACVVFLFFLSFFLVALI